MLVLFFAGNKLVVVILGFTNLNVSSGQLAYGSRACGLGWFLALDDQFRSSSGRDTNSVGLKSGFLVDLAALTLSSYF